MSKKLNLSNQNLKNREYFEIVLNRSLNLRWAHQPSFKYSIKYLKNKNTLKGKLNVFGIGKKTGKKVLLLEENFDELSNKNNIDEWVADKLSQMLMNHMYWPR